MPPAKSPALRPSHLPPVELYRPADLGELLAHAADGVHLLAGGTDLVVWASQCGEPRRLAWIGSIDQLQTLDITSDRAHIGAAVTLSRIVRSGQFRSLAPAVVDGAGVVGSVQLRNQATLVGNVCTASPGGDTIPALHVHDAALDIVSAAGDRRSVKISDFVHGPGQTDLNTGEVVTGVTLRGLGQREGSAFSRFTQRNALDLAIASVAACLSFESDGRTVARAHLSMGAVGPTVLDADEAARSLVGHPLEPARLRNCADLTAECCRPITDHRASADYRRQLVRTLTMDVVDAAAERAIPGWLAVEAP